MFSAIINVFSDNRYSMFGILFPANPYFRLMPDREKTRWAVFVVSSLSFGLSTYCFLDF